VLSGSIQVKQVDKVLEIGMSLTEWGSRGISTRRKMLKAGRVRPQSGTIEAHQLKIAVLAPISALLHDSDTGFPSSKSRSNQRDPVTYGALHMKLHDHYCVWKKRRMKKNPATPAERRQNSKRRRRSITREGEQTCGTRETRYPVQFRSSRPYLYGALAPFARVNPIFSPEIPPLSLCTSLQLYGTF
jgi:hypothetical protein